MARGSERNRRRRDELDKQKLEEANLSLSMSISRGGDGVGKTVRWVHGVAAKLFEEVRGRQSFG